MDIGDETRIPLFAVLTALPVLIGFIFWLSTIYAVATSAEETNAAQEVKIEQTRDLLLDIRERIIRIEEKISRQ